MARRTFSQTLRSDNPSSDSQDNFNPDLFANVVYFFNDDVSEEERGQAKAIFDSAKGVEYKPESDGSSSSTATPSLADSTLLPSSSTAIKPRFELDKITHVIANTHRFPEYSLCRTGERSDDVRLPWVVTTEWARRCDRFGSIVPEQYFPAHTRMIFSGVVICCIGLRDAQASLINASVESYGGASRAQPSNDSTHIITRDITSDRFQSLRRRLDADVRVVAPEWIDESIMFRRRMPLDKYEFNLRTDEKPLCLNNDYVAALDDPSDADGDDRISLGRGSTSRSPSPDNQAFKGKNVYLGQAAAKLDRRLDLLQAWIRHAGGNPVLPVTDGSSIEQAVRNSDIVIAKYRDSEEYREAVRQNKTVGTMTWVLAQLGNNAPSNPRDDLRHYPVLSRQRSVFKDQKISVSQYSGKKRLYVRDLAQMLGAKVTGEFSSSHTLCISATNQGEKVEMAQVWGIPVVNHLYLEDAILEGRRPDPYSRQYTYYPSHIKYSDMVEPRRIDDEVVASWMEKALQESGNQEPSSDPVSEAAEVATTNADPSDANAAASSVVDLTEESSSSRFQTAREDVWSSESAVNRHDEPSESSEANKGMVVDESRELDPPTSSYDSIADIELAAPKATEPSGTAQEIRQSVTPGSSKRKRALSKKASEEDTPTPGEKEALTSVPKGAKRSKKDKALKASDSHNQSSDATAAARSERLAAELPSTPKKVSAKKVRSSKDAKGEGATKRRSVSASPFPGLSPTTPKRSSAHDTPGRSSGSRKLTVATTGYILSDAERKAIVKAGMSVTDNVNQADILVASKFGRTAKMLCAIAMGTIEVVNSQWVKDVVEAKDAVEVQPHHLLKDQANEKKFGAKLEASLERSRKHPGQLLKGHKFFLTSKISPDRETLRTIIEAAGGTVINRSTIDSIHLVEEPQWYHLISSVEDRSVWGKLAGDPTAIEGETVKVWSSELIISSVLKQVMEWDKHTIHEQASGPANSKARKR